MIYSDLGVLSVISTIRRALNKSSGVYAFQNISTGEFVYVGSSVNLARRFMSHSTGTGSNILLQRAFAKYGISAFNFVVLKEYHYDWDLSTQENRDELLALEQYYLDLLFPRYNISPTAGSSLGVKRSEEFRAKIRAAFIGVPLTEQHRRNMVNGSRHRYKPVYFYDEQLNLVTMYESLNATCRAEHANKNHLLKCINTGQLFRGWLVTYTQINIL